jgi:hypothetical protein
MLRMRRQEALTYDGILYDSERSGGKPEGASRRSQPAAWWSPSAAGFRGDLVGTSPANQARACGKIGRSTNARPRFLVWKQG